MSSNDLSKIGYGVFRRTREPLILFDPETGRILGANSAAARATGFGVGSLRRRGLVDLFPDDGRPFDPPDGGSTTIGRRRLRTRDGRTVPVLLDVGRIRTASGPVGLLTIREPRPGGHERPASRSPAGLGHEIRTPLTAMLARTEAMLRDPNLRDAPPALRENLAALERDGRHLLEVLDDVLDLSRIEVGKLDVAFRPCSPLALVEETVALLKPKAEAKGLPLVVEREGFRPGVLHTDPTRVRRILTNLVANAIRYTDRGEIRIRVAPEGASRLRFDVIDTGAGIPPETLPLLFEPFERGPSAAPAGTGLGLAICRELTERLGGSIEVRSEPGRGSTFSLILEAGPSREPLGGRSAEIPPLPTGAVGARVLLAEDDPGSRSAIAECLRIAGIEVETAADGAEAVERTLAAEAAGRPFDVVLMDLQLPVLDGYECVRRLRLEGYLLPVVALSAQAAVEAEEDCLLVGCDAYAPKPVDWRRLVSLIGELRDDFAARRPG